MKPLCRITLFGELRLQQDDYIIRLRKKEAELLAYLALHPDRAHSREVLQEQLWPGAEDDRGGRFRTTLSNLGKTLDGLPQPAGGILISNNRKYISLNPQAVAVDKAEFETLLKRVSASQDMAEQIALLEQAVEMLAEELLPGYDVEEINEERRRIADLHESALKQLVTLLEESAEIERAIRYGKQWSRLDSLDEEASVALMRLYAVVGQPLEVRRQFQQWEQALREELNERPSAEMELLVKRLEAEALKRLTATGPLVLPNVSDSTNEEPAPPAAMPVLSKGAPRRLSGSARGILWLVPSVGLLWLVGHALMGHSEKPEKQSGRGESVQKPITSLPVHPQPSLPAPNPQPPTPKEISKTQGEIQEPIPITVPKPDPLPPVGPPLSDYLLGFSRGRGTVELWIANADGTEETCLTPNLGGDSTMEWSPDGTQFAFASERYGNWEICIQKIGSSKITRLTHQKDAVQGPRWSPDRKHLVFYRAQGDYTAQIIAIDVNTFQETQLTSDEGWSSNPCWSPDGSQIAYFHKGPHEDGIYVMQADGSKPHRIAGPDGPIGPPDWSHAPSQNQIVFNHAGNIFTLNMDTKEIQQLTYYDRPAGGPARWSPDGKWIAYINSNESPNALWIMRPDGSHQSPVTRTREPELAPTWYPIPGKSPPKPERRASSGKPPSSKTQ